MQPIDILTSHAVPLDISNIDTDQIIPKQFLKRIERTGYGEFLFFDWRRLQEPRAAAHEDERAVLRASGLKPGDPDPTFALNQPQFAGAKILIAGKNFGCGSSREHAAWALTDFGFLAVIAPSFADIFFSNAGKNGMILVRLPEAEVQLLTQRASAGNHVLTISLEAQTVTDNQGYSGHFEMDPFRKYCLLNGLDDIGLTLRHAVELDTFEAAHDREFWLWPRSADAGART